MIRLCDSFVDTPIEFSYKRIMNEHLVNKFLPQPNMEMKIKEAYKEPGQN